MSDDCGLIETIQDAISIHSIKKQGYKRLTQDKTTYSLHDYFLEEYRDPDKLQYARECFMMSLAGYSIVCYLLQIKDRYVPHVGTLMLVEKAYYEPRHNGNILIDTEGHCIHIDFGFMLSNSPGSVGFELAPFKLSTEYIDILDGVGSPLFERFIEVLTEAFLSLRKKADWLVGLVEIMESGKDFFISVIGVDS